MDFAIAEDVLSPVFRADDTELFSRKNNPREATPMITAGMYFSMKEQISAMTAIAMTKYPSPPSSRLFESEAPNNEIEKYGRKALRPITRLEIIHRFFLDKEYHLDSVFPEYIIDYRFMVSAIIAGTDTSLPSVVVYV